MCNKKMGWIPDSSLRQGFGGQAKVWDDKNKKIGRILKLSLLVLMLSVAAHEVQAVLVGSDSAASRQTSLLSFPQIDVNNEMRGFTSIEAGFTLASLLTTCTYNALLSVAGDATFNNGRMHLNEDLFFDNNFRFMDGALIRGNGKALIFPASVLDFTVPVSSGVLRLDNTVLDLNSNIILGGLWRIRGICKIIGNGKKLALGTGDLVLELGSGAQLELMDVFLTGVGSSNLRCLTSNGVITLVDSTISLARDFTFSTGALLFKNDVVVTGTSNFNYQSATASRILSGSTLYVNNGVTFNYAPSVANKNLLVMSDATSGLYLNGANLFCTTTGLRLSTGTLYLDNKVTISSQATNSGQAMEFNSNLNIRVLAGAVLDVFGKLKYV